MTDGLAPGPAPGPASDPVEAAAIVALDPAGRILAELCCRGCGYSVRGLRPADDCPECTMPVSRSLRGDALRFANPQWLRRLRLGCRWYVIGGIASVALVVGMIVVSMAAGFAGAASFTGELQLVAVLIGAITAGASVLGAWLLTTPDPAGSAETRLTVRSAARAGLIAHMLSAPTAMYWSGPANIVAVLGMAAGLVALVGWVLYFLHLHRLVLRLPAPRLARQLRLIAIGFGAFATLTSAGGLVTGWLLPAAAAGGPLYLTIAFTTCGATAMYFGIEVWAVVVHFVLAARLRACLSSTVHGQDAEPVAFGGHQARASVTGRRPN